MPSSSEDLFDRRKLALIIGNGNYSQRINKLDQSVKNANDLANLLKTINFDVMTQNNIPNEIMKRIQEFVDEFKIRDGDLILVFFSGNAYQFNGRNYLIPIDDTRIDDDEDVEVFGTDVKRILDRLMENRPSCVVVFILDCCRPYVLKNASKSTCK
jgi:uncharacterized caspase-like protein